ncbi:hypothetical protein NDU88_000181 [Pleurodeles waltl]|uniref:Uncharacterized protein n=1 Tax=Pleurodeles waltl TaxID=8319 RepID=A0AAV7S4H5_PLEWA|nr:hypothetical protein NDU88_000181 [Pleurodeles waltl]
MRRSDRNKEAEAAMTRLQCRSRGVLEQQRRGLEKAAGRLGAAWWRGEQGVAWEFRGKLKPSGRRTACTQSCGRSVAAALKPIRRQALKSSGGTKCNLPSCRRGPFPSCSAYDKTAWRQYSGNEQVTGSGCTEVLEGKEGYNDCYTTGPLACVDNYQGKIDTVLDSLEMEKPQV